MGKPARIYERRKQVKKIDIKGKEYVPVNERLIYFRTQDEYKDWLLITEIITLDNEVCVMKASAINPENKIMATGHAREVNGSTYINKTSYVENCETSAIGRCLASLGIGVDTSLASFEEVANAVINQNKPKAPTKEEKWKNFIDNEKKVFEENTFSFNDAVIDLGYDMETIYKVTDEDDKSEIYAKLTEKLKELKGK